MASQLASLAVLTSAMGRVTGIAARPAVVVLLGLVVASCTSGASHHLAGESALAVGGQCKTTESGSQVMDATVSNPTAYIETVRLSTGAQGMEMQLEPRVTEHPTVPGCGDLTAKVIWASRVNPSPGAPTPSS